MTRVRAFALHLLISIGVALLLVIPLLTLWYPGPHLELTGAGPIVLVVLAVHMIVGPALTLIVFRPGKRGLRVDLVAIATIQMAAFIYGAGSVYSQRPLYLTFEIDRFRVISAKHLDAPAPADSVRFAPWARGPDLAALDVPPDPEARRRLLTETMFAGLEPSFRPSLYRAYPPDNLAAMGSRALDVAAIEALNPDHAERLSTFARQIDRRIADLWLFPVVGDADDAVAAIAPKTGALLGLLPIDPFPTG